MNKDYLNPWYKLNPDPQQKCLYRGTASAAYLYKPQPKPQRHAPQKDSSRPADLVLMELTVKARKAVTEGQPFEWPDDDSYYGVCSSWFNEQKDQGLSDVVYLCGVETHGATGKFLGCCLGCWYADGHREAFFPGEERDDSGIKPVLKSIRLKWNYKKPVFADNAEEFVEALQAIADFAPFDAWKNKFKTALAIMTNEKLRYLQQENTFDIEPPYFRYLCAAQYARLGAGMGSWSDLPIAGTESFKSVTQQFSTARDNALMYAINNC